ncbi:ribokinase [Staphylococcus caprae]|uniref:ribokinase n=1 Tax=Staphylococcus caprae TaxID=29380 RepID=UPI00254D1B81|nr:ribokinase [Staphylococcus caprae]MDK6297818.1 ribokinase [Staphylococcus caprae]MDK7231651.1 ribokinase [Staphylococcus caprae]
MSKNKVVIVGSTNVDKFINVERFPKPGETLHIDQAQQEFGGGKGANQAIAAGRLEAETTFITKVGKEGNADFIIDDFKEASINTDYILTSENEETGQAFITVTDEGQNTILVYGGANMTLNAEDVNHGEQAIREADFVVAQLEIPIEAIEQAFKIAKAHGVTTILNPAPAIDLPDSLLSLTDIIIPNETEAERLSGISIKNEADMQQTVDYFFERGISTVLITLGEQGTYFATQHDSHIVPAYQVKAIDTTAAGDTFIGAFVSRLEKDLSNLEDAIRFANQASSLTVQRKGAQASIPTYKEVTAQYQ